MNEQWQRTACAVMGLPFVRSNGVCQGGANVVLTCPHRLEKIRGDGNCLFRSFSHIITGTQNHYKTVRSAIVAHMPSIEPYSGIHSVVEYFRTSVRGRGGYLTKKLSA